MSHTFQSVLQKTHYLLAVAGTALLALPLSAQAQSAPSQGAISCRPLGKSDTVVIIDASTADRLTSINQVVQQHNLQGEFCVNRVGRTVWMSDQIDDADNAVQVFNYFKEAGVVRPVRVRRTA